VLGRCGTKKQLMFLVGVFTPGNLAAPVAAAPVAAATASAAIAIRSTVGRTAEVSQSPATGA